MRLPERVPYRQLTEWSIRYHLAGLALAATLTTVSVAAQDPLTSPFPPKEVIDQDEGDYIDVPADLGTLAADSSAVVIATFMGASGEASEVEPDVPRLKTFNRFRLVETLKVDPRLPEVGSTLDVLDGGGGSITRSKPFRAVKLSPDSQLLVPGHSYVLYLHWHAPESRFYLTFGRYSVFDVTGPVALPVDPSSPLASAVAGLGPGEGLVALRASAMSSQKPQPAFDTP